MDKTWLYAFNERLTPALRTHTDWKWWDGEDILCKQVVWIVRRAGVAIFISDNIDIKPI